MTEEENRTTEAERTSDALLSPLERLHLDYQRKLFERMADWMDDNVRAMMAGRHE